MTTEVAGLGGAKFYGSDLCGPRVREMSTYNLRALTGVGRLNVPTGRHITITG